MKLKTLGLLSASFVIAHLMVQNAIATPPITSQILKMSVGNPKPEVGVPDLKNGFETHGSLNERLLRARTKLKNAVATDAQHHYEDRGLDTPADAQANKKEHTDLIQKLSKLTQAQKRVANAQIKEAQGGIGTADLADYLSAMLRPDNMVIRAMLAPEDKIEAHTAIVTATNQALENADKLIATNYILASAHQDKPTTPESEENHKRTLEAAGDMEGQMYTLLGSLGGHFDKAAARLDKKGK